MHKSYLAYLAILALGLAQALACGLGAGEALPAFTRKPTAERQGDKIKIEFAVAKETDVAVFIEDEKGKVLRHLSAGVLGKNAPSPLAPNTLAQTLLWDGLADYGKPAGTGPFKVRVALGLGARYDKVLIHDRQNIGGVNALAVGPDGTLYVAMSCGGTGPVWSGQQMVAFNRDGTYQRMLMPFPSNLKPDEVKGFDVLEAGGKAIPLVHEMQKRSFYAANMARRAGMAVTPGGQILTLAGFNIGALDVRGAAPWGSYLGQRLLPNRRAMFGGGYYIAVSGSGTHAYVSGLMDYLPEEKPPHKVFAAVYRVKLPERGPAEPFFGDPMQAGNDETHLGGAPRGLAADGKGHLLIADYANNRVVVITEQDRKVAGTFAVQAPDCLAVDAASGAVYVSRLTGQGNVELVKYSGWKDAKEVAKVKLACSGNPEFPWSIALDDRAKPPLLWAGSDMGDLRRIEDLGDKFGPPQSVASGEIGNASFVDLSVDRVRKEIYTRCGGGGGPIWWFRYNEETGELKKVAPGPGVDGSSQLVAAPDGTLYLPCYPQQLSRFDRDGKPLAWENSRKDSDPKNKPASHTIYSPFSMTFLGHTLGFRHDGRLFIFEPPKPGGRPPKALFEYDSSGQRAAEPIIWKVSDSAVGPRFDPQGNIYIADQIKPLGQPYPPEFASFVGPIELSKTYIEGFKEHVPNMYGSILKFSPKGGMIHHGGENAFTGEPKLDPALKTVDASVFAGCRLHPIKVSGAEWMHMGVSHVDAISCNCENIRFDVDEFGRVFYPDMGLFRVGVLDTNGNLILHFGGYGNAESCGPDSPVFDPKSGRLRPRQSSDPAGLKSPFAEPEIAFSWLVGVGVTDRYVYMGDSLNRRLLRARLIYAAEESCRIP